MKVIHQSFSGTLSFEWVLIETVNKVIVKLIVELWVQMSELVSIGYLLVISRNHMKREAKHKENDYNCCLYYKSSA